MSNWEDQIKRQISLKQEIDNLPDGERYTARQRWLEDSIELLLLYMLEVSNEIDELVNLTDRRRP
jgi:hypothetical protein